MPRRLVLIAALLPVLLLTAPGADAGFAPQVETVATSTEVEPVIAVAPDAEGIVAWAERPGGGMARVVVARRLSAAGELGPVLDLKPGGPAQLPAVGIGPDGRAFVVWRSSLGIEPSTIEGRWVNRDGSLGPLVTVVAGDPGVTVPVEPQVVVAPSGVATVGWRNEASNTIAMRRVGADSSLSALLPDVSGTGTLELRLAATPSGGTLLTWSGTGIEKNYVGPDLSVGTPQTISTGSVAWPEIATDALGNSLIAWRQSNSEPFSVRGRLIDPSGEPIGEELTIDPNLDGFLGVRATVAADSAGDFLVGWNRRVGTLDQAFTRRVSLDGTFPGPAQQVSAGVEGESSQPRTALLDNGTGIVTWRRLLMPAGVSSLARTLDPLGVPSSDPVPVAGIAVEQTASAPALGYSAALFENGKEALVRRYLEPPTCEPATATMRSRKGVVVPLSCFGAGIDAGDVVQAPKFGTVGPFDPAGPSVLYKPKPRQGGNDSFTYVVANDGGPAPSLRVEVKDRAKPLIKKVRLIQKGGALKLKVKADEPVRVKATAKGGGKAKSKRLALKPTIRLKGRLARRLNAGERVKLKLVATDRAGNKSRPKKARLRPPR